MTTVTDTHDSTLDDESAKVIRDAHFTREGLIKALGFLHMGVGIGWLVVLTLSFIGGSFEPGIFLLLVLAIVAVLLGHGLLRLRQWARYGVGILNVIALLNFPMGTLLGVAVLCLLFSKKGAMVFSERYQVVIAQEPSRRHLKPEFIKALVGMLVFFAALFLLILAMAGF